MSDATEMRDALCEMLANLEGYIEREAAKQAAPMVEQAQREANAAIQRARREAERATDLTGELKRRLGSLLEWQERALAAASRIGTALDGNTCPRPGLDALAAAVERRLAEDAATIERQRHQINDMTRASQMDEVRLPEYPEVSNA